MVFASLLEYAAVSYIGNRAKTRMRRRQTDGTYPGKFGERVSLLGNGTLSCTSPTHGEVSDPLHTVGRMDGLVVVVVVVVGVVGAICS